MESFLVAFEYGSGRVWGFVLADSEEELVAELPEVDVYDAPPAWMTTEEVVALRTDAVPLHADDVIDELLVRQSARAVRIA